jgi:hypothetical protein
VGFAANGEMSFAADSIGAGQDCDEGRSKLADKGMSCIHGVLLRKGAFATPF